MLHRVTTKYVCGVDLHAKTLTGVIMDLEGKIQRKGTVACEVPRVMELLGPYAGDVTVGVESTYNWYWLIDALHQAEIPCVLGHALYVIPICIQVDPIYPAPLQRGQVRPG